MIRHYSITWQAVKLKCYSALIKETKQQQWSGYYKYLLEGIQQFILFRSEFLFTWVPPLASSQHRSDRRHIHSTLVPQSCYNILATYGLWKCLCFSNSLENNEKNLEKEVALVLCSKPRKVLKDSWFNLEKQFGWMTERVPERTKPLLAEMLLLESTEPGTNKNTTGFLFSVNTTRRVLSESTNWLTQTWNW